MDRTLLVSELQALVAETKRRHPEVRDASEQALEVLKDGSVVRDALSGKADILLAPVTLGCKTKTAKIIGISISALQRLVALGGVPTAALPGVLQTLSEVAGQGVDIQLKLLQTLLSILTYNPDIHNEVLGNTLLLCFKLQESRVSVVSSTAAATLRQAVMLVFDRLAIPDDAIATLDLPDGPIQITPAALDAYYIFSDLCLLTARSGSGGILHWGAGTEEEKPRLLKLSHLHRTFGLELIESILSGYEEGVKKRPELLHLLSDSLDPLLLKLLEKPTFPIALRVCRLIFLLIRSFTDQLPQQVEVYLLTLIRLGMSDDESWLRVLSLEIIRGICGDHTLLQKLWLHFDQPDGPKLFSKLVSSLSRLLNEKPVLLGISAQMHGLGLPSDNNSGLLDMGIGMMASGVSTVSSMMVTSAGGGLGIQSGLKLRLIEQHDKSEAPSIPETYIYLLALQSLDAVAEGIFTASLQAPSPSIAGMADAAWPALLAALSFAIATNLSDTLFSEVLSSIQDFAVACGHLKLETPRNAFLNTLGKYAVPPPLVSAMQSHIEAPSQRNPSVTEGLGLGTIGGTSGPPSLSERNLACLQSFIGTARQMANSLGAAWHDVLEVMQNANFMLARRAKRSAVPPGSSPRPLASLPEEPRSHLIDSEDVHLAINAFFDSSSELDDGAFAAFLSALCQLSLEMVGEQHLTPPMTPKSPMSPSVDMRRRASGLAISTSMKSGERSFSLGKLRVVGLLNLQRIIAEPSWTTITQHLLSLARHATAPSTIRLQASDTLGELLLGVMRVVGESRVQHQVFAVLGAQVALTPTSSIIATDYDVRSSGFQTLNQILESSGHSLQVGWMTIFDMLNSVCQPGTPHKGGANLVRIAFPSLNLICTDFLSSLDPESMRQCITCLGHFGRQKEDVNITLSAIGLMWNVSDAVQADSKDLWLNLLMELLELGRDSRLEVRSSAMQTLFRCVELYGASLTPELWEDILWKVVFPVIEAAQGDESVLLALASIGNIFNANLGRLQVLPSFEKVYGRLLEQIKQAFASGPKACSAALKALERILATSQKSVLDPTWQTFVQLGEDVSKGGQFTQENLIALVRIAALLHDQIDLAFEQQKQLTSILRSIMTYAESPDYRPDVDIMSPLQLAVVDLISQSSKLASSLVLSDLAEFASLAYLGAGVAGKPTHVALSKACLPKIAQVFQNLDELSLYEDETVESVLRAYGIPIKMKYDCPAPHRFGNDQPLWKTAMETVCPVLEKVMPRLGTEDLPSERFVAIWSLIIDIFGGILLVDNSSETEEDERFVLGILNCFKHLISPRIVDDRLPDHMIEQLAEVLRRASQLHHYDVRSEGGTTAPSVNDTSELTRYWAFDMLITAVSFSPTTAAESTETSRKRVVRLVVPSLLRRFRQALQSFVDDGRLRGKLPFGRVREEEILYVLRHLATLRIPPDTIPSSGNGILSAVTASSSRAHLFHFYPLLLEISFFSGAIPSMWIFPSEYTSLFDASGEDHDHAPENGNDQDQDQMKEKEEVNGSSDLRAMEKEATEVDAGDGGDLIEVTARDLARRCLELVGMEMGMGGEILR